MNEQQNSTGRISKCRKKRCLQPSYGDGYHLIQFPDFPCIATFSVLVKELGIKDLFKLTGIMLHCVVITGSLL